MAPENTPIAWPPMMFLGLAVTSLGTAKTMKAVDPIDAVTIGFFWTFRRSRTAQKMAMARKLWPR